VLCNAELGRREMVLFLLGALLIDQNSLQKENGTRILILFQTLYE